MSLQPMIKPNDRLARIIITVLSVVVFAVVVALDRMPPLEFPFDFDVHYLAMGVGIINTLVAALLLAGLQTARKGNFILHKRIMFTAIILSILFLVFYIGHHLFAGSTKYGGEGVMRYIYYTLLITHIFLAAIVLPFILFTAYRAITGEYGRHKKNARLTWPIWFYVAVSGVIVYLMIKPYY